MVIMKIKFHYQPNVCCRRNNRQTLARLFRGGTMRGVVLLATCLQLVWINVAYGSAFTDFEVRSTAHMWPPSHQEFGLVALGSEIFLIISIQW